MQKKMLSRALRSVAAGALTLGLVLASPGLALACTQVWMPAAYTANGARYSGRSEDYAPRHVKIFGVEEAQDNVTYTSDESDFSYTSPKRSYRYTYVRDHPSDWGGRFDAYSEAGVNEKGVSCSSTLSTSMNAGIAAVDPLTSTGIGEYSYASVVLGECATAREGVELLGRLVDEQGTCTNDQLLINDADESWVFITLSGHQWVAFQLPEDQASVNPNMSNLRFSVDLDDAETCLHSEDIVSLPQENGLLVTDESGKIDLAATYGEADDAQGTGQNTRYYQGLSYFGVSLPEERYTAGAAGITSIAAPELFFTPARDGWTTLDMIGFFAARGEGTAFDANKNEALYAIGNNRTVESHLFEIREDLPADIATIQWEALSRAEFSIAIPLYSALITEVSPYFGDLSMSAEHQGNQGSDDVASAMVEEENETLPFILMDINTLCYNNREALAGGAHDYLDALQAQLVAQNEQVDELMRETPAEKRGELANHAANVAAEQVYERCSALLAELRAYLKAGDLSEPFAASDFDPVAGDLVTPLDYAGQVLPDEPEPEPEPEPTPEPEPAPEVPGTSEDPATPQGPAGTEQPAGADRPSSVGGGAVPETGDPASLAAVLVLGSAGLVAAGASVVVRRRA